MSEESEEEPGRPLPVEGPPPPFLTRGTEVQEPFGGLQIAQHNFEGLSEYTSEFIACVVLWQNSDSQRIPERNDKMYTRWRWIAAKQGIVSLYNFRSALKAVIRLARSHPNISQILDFSVLEEALRRFDELVPNCTELRQTVMHEAELYANTNRRNENLIRRGLNSPLFNLGQEVKAVIRNSSFGDIYMQSFQGKLHQYAISKDTAIELYDICALAFQAVKSVPAQRGG